SSMPADELSPADIKNFSPEARAILDRADKIRESRGRKSIHMRDLIRAMAQREGNQLSQLVQEAQFDLETLLMKIPRLSPRETPIEVEGLPPVSNNVYRALIAARDKAKETQSHPSTQTARMTEAPESSEIGPNHILFGALTRTEHPIIRALNGRGITA